MEGFQQWSEGTRAAFMRTGLAGFSALILILLFAIYIRFFPTPVSYLLGAESFTAATIDRPPTGTSRRTASAIRLSNE